MDPITALTGGKLCSRIKMHRNFTFIALPPKAAETRLFTHLSRIITNLHHSTIKAHASTAKFLHCYSKHLRDY